MFRCTNGEWATHTGALAHIRPDRIFEVQCAVQFMERVEELWRTRPRPDTFRGQASLEPMKPSLTREGGPAACCTANRLTHLEKTLLDAATLLGNSERPVRNSSSPIFETSEFYPSDPS